MNIHFKDEKLFHQLMDSALITVEVGSKMYGISGDKSDTDILVIYAESEENEHSFVWTHHQLQYKKDNVDYMFTTITKFIQNLIKGDQTIFTETVLSPTLTDYSTRISVFSDSINPMRWLYKLAVSGYFISYSTINAYLGFAKRDLKSVRSMLTSDSIASFNDPFMKKLSHFYRGVHCARILLGSIDSSSGVSMYGLKNIMVQSGEIKNGTYFKDFITSDENGLYKANISVITNFIDDTEKMMELQKKKLVNMFDTKNINKYMSVRKLNHVDDMLKDFIKSDYYKFKQRKVIEYGEIFYDVLENDVSYSKGDK